ncbi:MAG TPA: AsnC family protein [Dongiaceae bacterium]
MVISEQDRNLLQTLSAGLPLDPRPYAKLGKPLGLSEGQVIDSLRRLISSGVIKRFGVIVRHWKLGYRANAMAVWDVPDALAAEAGRRLAALDFVTLCYRRPRALPDWPYNLFCMIHGRSRSDVETQVRQAAEAAAIEAMPQALLFSTTCFKQRGARFKRERPILESELEGADGRA